MAPRTKRLPAQQRLIALVARAPKVSDEAGIGARRWLAPLRAELGDEVIFGLARAGRVVLHRCDLVQCYPAALVAESEIIEPMTGARFHQLSLTKP